MARELEAVRLEVQAERKKREAEAKKNLTEVATLSKELEAVRVKLQLEKKKREADRAGRVRAEALLRKKQYGAGDEEGERAPAVQDTSTAPSGHVISGPQEASGAIAEWECPAAKGGGGGVGGMVEMKVIGRIRSCFRRRFGAPRQGSVVAGSRGVLRIASEWNPAMSTGSIDQYSHVWLLYIFHENTNLGGKSQVKSKVRPPRLGGEKVGLFATRTPHRPNPLGLSLVKLDRVVDGVLYLSGLDLLDGTPILDVKPFLPPTDSVPPHLARAATWFEELPDVDNASVTISEEASQQLRFFVRDLEFYDSYEDVWGAIEEILRFDIRSRAMKDAAGRRGDAANAQAETPQAHKPADDAGGGQDDPNFHFDNVLVYFSVTGASRVEVTRIGFKRVALPGTAPRPSKLSTGP